MTLLNTVSNLGGTWPKPLILRSVDMLTVATCSVSSSTTTSLRSKLSLSSSASGLGECVTEHGKNLCAQAGGECVMQRDGYYIMSAVCVTLGAGLLVVFILPMVKRLAGKSPFFFMDIPFHFLFFFFLLAADSDRADLGMGLGF